MATAMLTKYKLCMTLTVPMTVVANAKMLRLSKDVAVDAVVADDKDDDATQYCVRGKRAKGNVPRMLPKRKLLYKPK